MSRSNVPSLANFHFSIRAFTLNGGYKGDRKHSSENGRSQIEDHVNQSRLTLDRVSVKSIPKQPNPSKFTDKRIAIGREQLIYILIIEFHRCITFKKWVILRGLIWGVFFERGFLRFTFAAVFRQKVKVIFYLTLSSRNTWGSVRG